MLLPGTLKSTLKRARRPSSWVAILGFGLLWNAARALILSAPIHWEEALLPLAVGAVGLVLAPIPWQWTADSRPLASPFRGFLQAVPWNLAWVAVIFVLLPFHGPGEGGQGGGNGPGGGGMGRGRGRWATEQRAAEQSTTLSPRMLALAAAAFAFAMALGLVLAQKERAEFFEEEARESLNSAQLRALQAQMNPHALFNLISALSEMARENPSATEEGLMSLAGLLRRLLDHSARSRAPLADERALVETYLELEQIRLGSRLEVQWDWDPVLDALQAQPLLLQPLVENAIKHGIAPCREGGRIRITLRQEGAMAVLRVANTGAPFTAEKDGVGLANLRQRLDLVEKGRATFSLRAEEGWTIAEILTPVHAHG